MSYSSAKSGRAHIDAKASRPSGEAVERKPEVSRDVEGGKRHVGNFATLQFIAGSGVPLSPALRGEMEVRFGEDFASVRIHDNSDAHDAAEGLDANAYAIGESVVFNSGRYAPGTIAGKRLLAHELAHVVQQRRGGAVPSPGGEPVLEASADETAGRVSVGLPAQVAGASAPGVMRDDSGRRTRRKASKFRPKRQSIEEDAKLGPDSGAVHRKREKDKDRTEQRKGERATAGKTHEQIGSEESADKLRKMDQHVRSPGGNLRSPKRRERKLKKFERLQGNVDAPTLDKNKRKGNFDEAQRTPKGRGAKSQQEFVAGGQKLQNQELVSEQGRKVASHTRTDYSLYRRKSDGTLERIHVNLKSNQVDQMTLGEARTASREILYQAVKNKAHLPLGEKLIIDFAHVPSPEIQEAIKHELFRQGRDTPVAEIRFGSLVHRERDYSPEGGRQPLDTHAKARRDRLAAENKAAQKKANAEQVRQRADEARAKKQDAQYRARLRKKEKEAAAAGKRKKMDTMAPATTAAKSAQLKDVRAQETSRKEDSGAPTKKVAKASAKRGGSRTSAKRADTRASSRKTDADPAPKKSNKKSAPTKTDKKTPAKRADPTTPGNQGGIGAPAKKTASNMSRMNALAAPKRQGEPAGAQFPKKAATADPRVQKAEPKEGMPKEIPSSTGRPRLPASTKPRLATAVTAKSYFNDQVRVNVDEYVGEAKPFRVTTTFTLTIGAEVGLQGQSRPTSGGPEASGGLNVGASGTLTVSSTKAMTGAEKDQYLADVAAGRGGTSRELTIVELIAKGRTQEAVAAVRQAQSMMKGRLRGEVGDVQELGLEGNVSIGASVGAQGEKGMGGSVGGTVQISNGKAIRRTGVRLADGRELYTVSIIDLSSQTIGASVGYGVASIGYNAGRRQSEAHSVSFTLDPEAADYAQRKAEIFAVTKEDELDTIADRHRNLYFGGAKNKDKSKVGTTSAGIFVVGIDIDQGEIDEESESEDPGGKTYTMRGGGSIGGSFTVLGRRVNPSSVTDTFGATIGQDNRATGYAQSEEVDVDLSKTANNLGQSLKDAPLATAYGIVSGNKEVLKERVHTKGVDLPDDAFEVIAKKAEDKREWDSAWNLRGISHGAGDDWEATRQAVLTANHDRRKIAAALKAWEKGDSGRSGDIARLAGGSGIGFEFPDAIASERAIYDQLVFADPIPGALEAGDPAAVNGRLRAISERLAQLEKAIGDHVTEIEPKTFVEMSRRIGARRKAARIELFKRASLPNRGVDDVTPSVGDKRGGRTSEGAKDRETPTAAKDADTVVAEQKNNAFEAEERKNEAADIVRRLTKYKVTEASVFANMDKELNSFWGASTIKLINEERRIRFAYKDWDKDIARLRELVKEGGGDVSSVDRYAPNRQRYLELDRKIPYHSYGSGLPGYEATE